MRRWWTAALVALLCANARMAGAQPEVGAARWSLDSAIAINRFVGENAADRPDLVIDLNVTTRIGHGWTAYVRPWFRKQSNTPYTLATELYQAVVQHERSGRIATRVELGYILSPIGIGMMDMRPDTNPTILTHMTYVIPMPPFERTVPSSMPIASSYPLGGQLTASMRHWDGRVAAVTSTPNRSFVLGANDGNPPSRPIFVTGGGFTPRTGMRVGASYATGAYVTSSELNSSVARSRGSQLFTVEADLAFNYTHITGEWARARLETATSDVPATSWFIQGQQTLTPRWFVAARQEGANAPPSVIGIANPTLRTFEGTAGFRLNPEFTLRSSFASRKTYYSPLTNAQVGVSVVWAKRWR